MSMFNTSDQILCADYNKWGKPMYVLLENKAKENCTILVHIMYTYWFLTKSLQSVKVASLSQGYLGN